MPKKSPGGYLLLDLGGVNIPTDGTSINITGPKSLMDTFLKLYEAKINKPIYVSNFTIGNTPYGTLYAINSSYGNDTITVPLDGGYKLVFDLSSVPDWVQVVYGS